MSYMSRGPVVVVESLENRRLFSVPAGMPWPLGLAFAPGSSGLPGVPAAPVAASNKVAFDPTAGLNSVTTPEAPPITTNLGGHWTGKVKANLFLFFSKSYKVTLDITGQDAGSVTGQLVIKGHKIKATFTGGITSDGAFHYQYSADDVEVKLDGQLNHASTIASGDATVKYKGFSAGGTFEIRRRKPVV